LSSPFPPSFSTAARLLLLTRLLMRLLPLLLAGTLLTLKSRRLHTPAAAI
jgi:hypothetical protein